MDTVPVAGSAISAAAATSIAIGLAGLGATLAQGRAVAAALDGAARNPGAIPAMRGLMILGLGMIESVLVLAAVFLTVKG